MIYQKYKLNLDISFPKAIVPVSQYDSGSRTISFEIYKGDELYSLAGRTATFKFDQNGTLKQYACTVGDNVSFVVTSDMTAIAGNFVGEIEISGVGSNNFVWSVSKTPLD